MGRIYGYFDSPEQVEPVHDPPLTVSCPVCGKELSRPVKTISLMVPLPNGGWPERSYFYRTHKHCYDNLDETGKSRIDGLLVDAIVNARNTN